MESIGSQSNCTSSSQTDPVVIISLVTASSSLVGSGSVLICSIFHRRICYPEIFPTFHLAIADLLASFVLISSSSLTFHTSDNGSDSPGSHGACDYLMAAVTSFYSSAFFLTVTYALEAYFRFRRKLMDSMNLDTSIESTVSNPWMYLIYVLAWLIPLTINFTIVSTEKSNSTTHDKQDCLECSACFPDFRFDDGDCWDSPREHKLIKIFFLLPLVVVMVSNLILYVMIRKVYRQLVIRRGLLSYHQRQEETLLKRKTFLYQSVFIMCWLPSIIAGIISFTSDLNFSNFYPLFIIQVLLAPLQGLLNSIVYGWKRDSFRRALTERSSLLGSNRSPTMSVTL